MENKSLQTLYIKNRLAGSVLFDPYVNVPFGVAHYKGKIFVTVPRRNPGIPATLNIVELIGKPPYINPLMIGFPSYQMNSLSVKKF